MKGLIFLFLAGASFGTYAADNVKIDLQQKKTLSSDGGRFVFGQISDMRRDQYMLDTKTGRLWNVAEKTIPASADGSRPSITYSVLQPISYIDNNGREYSEPK